MRIAALYDIHGNLPALEAVLEAVNKQAVDHIIVGGDVVAGPMPCESLDLLQAVGQTMPMTFLHGNAESEVLRFVAGEEPGGLSPQADRFAEWVASKLSQEQIQFITDWHLTYTAEMDDGHTVLFCHATPQNDIDIFTKQTPDDALSPFFAGIEAQTVICGHTHMQFDRFYDGMQIVNAGSVGMPFGKTGANWLLVDSGVTFMHTDYDLTAAAERIRNTDDPEAEDFASNNVLSSPTEAQALAFLTQLADRQAEKRTKA